MSLTGCRFRSIILTMMNMNGVTEMYGIQNHHGKYYSGGPRAYFYTRYPREAREWKQKL